MLRKKKKKKKYKWLPHPEPSVQSKLHTKAPVTNRTMAVDKEENTKGKVFKIASKSSCTEK